MSELPHDSTQSELESWIPHCGSSSCLHSVQLVVILRQVEVGATIDSEDAVYE